MVVAMMPNSVAMSAAALAIDLGLPLGHDTTLSPIGRNVNPVDNELQESPRGQNV